MRQSHLSDSRFPYVAVKLGFKILGFKVLGLVGFTYVFCNFEIYLGFFGFESLGFRYLGFEGLVL